MNIYLSFDFNDNLSVKNSYYTNTNYSCCCLVINNTDTDEMTKTN